MKIVCESCQAKYSISDDKVRGKAFKIRCKKCSNIIIVRSADGGGASPSAGVAEGAPAPEASGNSWHIVVDGEQVGPLPESDIRARLARGEISTETFIWREGMADWLKIAAVPDLARGAEQPQRTATPYPPGTAEAGFSPASAPPPQAEIDAFAAPTSV